MRAYASQCTDCGLTGPTRLSASAAEHAFAGHVCERPPEPLRAAPIVLADTLDAMATARWAVKTVCPWMTQRDERYEDLISDALLGITNAQLHHDPDAGANLNTWCRTKAVYAVRDGLRDRGHLRRTDLIAHRTIEDLPTWSQPPVSGDVPIATTRDTDAPVHLWDAVADESAATRLRHIETRAYVDWLLSLVTGREREVLVRHYLHELTLRVIAEDWGVTESRVCQVETSACAKIRVQVEAMEAADAWR